MAKSKSGSGGELPPMSIPPRAYIKPALAMTLEERRALLASLDEPTAKLLRAHLKWVWERGLHKPNE